MQIDVTAMSGASISLDVVYYYFTIDNAGIVTNVNYCYNDPCGTYSTYPGDFNNFKAGHSGYLFIPVPRGIV